MISHKAHNVSDFVFGLALIFLPLLSGIGEITASRNVFWGAGALIIFYSCATRYNYSFAKIISLRIHNGFDVLLGIFLILAPNLFSYRDLISNSQYGLEILMGILLIGLVGVSKFPRGGEAHYSKSVLDAGHFSFHNRS
jgi:hypothetical protein